MSVPSYYMHVLLSVVLIRCRTHAPNVPKFVVADKKMGGSKNWKNLLVAHSSAFPSTVTDDYVGPDNSILAETYQLTSLDPTTGVR